MKFLCFIFLSISLQSSGVLSKSTPKHYEAIFSFGDSLADTGNFLATGALAFPNVGRPPYGETFFHFPTGRCCNGRLIVDFITELFELPFLPAYLEVAKGQSCEHGVNFAVAGATAINTTFFYDRNLGSPIWTNDSLSVQLGWFKELKPTLCGPITDCASLFKKSLFIVGEIGGNDFNYPFFQGATIEQVTPIVPLVIQAIVGAIKMLIREGAVKLMVPGNLPFGCSASYLTLFRSPTISDYDSNGCLQAFNSFSQNYNSKLKLALDSLRLEYPHANIIYADYYGAAMQFYAAPQQFGFSNGALTACCGGGGPYNFNFSALCGSMGTTLCLDPSTYASWDGIHLTESAYKYIAEGLISGPFTSPPLTSSLA